MRVACFSLLALAFFSNAVPAIVLAELDVVTTGAPVLLFIFGILLVLYYANAAVFSLLLFALAVSIGASAAFLFLDSGNGLGIGMLIFVSWFLQLLATITGFFVASIYRDNCN